MKRKRVDFYGQAEKMFKNYTFAQVNALTEAFSEKVNEAFTQSAKIALSEVLENGGCEAYVAILNNFDESEIEDPLTITVSIATQSTVGDMDMPEYEFSLWDVVGREIDGFMVCGENRAAMIKLRDAMRDLLVRIDVAIDSAPESDE